MPSQQCTHPRRSTPLCKQVRKTRPHQNTRSIVLVSFHKAKQKIGVGAIDGKHPRLLYGDAIKAQDGATGAFVATRVPFFATRVQNQPLQNKRLWMLPSRRRIDEPFGSAFQKCACGFLAAFCRARTHTLKPTVADQTLLFVMKRMQRRHAFVMRRR